MKKMYRLSTGESYGYRSAYLQIVFDDNEKWDIGTGSDLTFSWQGDKGESALPRWYGFKLETRAEKVEAYKLAAKLMAMIEKELNGSLGNIQPVKLIEILEAKGYQEAKYNSCVHNFQTEKEWQNGSQFGIKLPGSRYDGYYSSVIAKDEKEALILARKMAAKSIEKDSYTQEWINYLQAPEVHFIQRGEEWQSHKGEFYPEVINELAAAI